MKRKPLHPCSQLLVSVLTIDYIRGHKSLSQNNVLSELNKIEERFYRKENKI